MVVRVVARGPDLLDDDLLLAVELGLVEQRVLEDVGEDVAGKRHVFLEHAGEIAGVLDRSRRIEVAADSRDGLGDGEGAARRCALESHVLEDVADAVLGQRFAARAGLHPDAEGGAFEVRHVVGNDGHAVVESGGPYAQTNSSPPGSAHE